MKVPRLAIWFFVLGVILLLPAILGMIIYTLGMGGVQHAACMPNVSFFLTCVSGSYVLVSTACGGIMWVIAFLVGLYAWAKKEKKD